jgi:hypothetical protein
MQNKPLLIQQINWERHLADMYITLAELLASKETMQIANEHRAKEFELRKQLEEERK